MTPQRLTAQEGAKFQCQVEDCGMLFSQCDFKAHLEMHDETRDHPFLCSVKDCAKNFDRRTDLERHQNIHEVQRNRCKHCSRMFAREEELKR
ncbi:hypothetical protein L207DRAFT_429185 [Hyaloscypha variabilis F]|uniref:C2H2-type domain-containing protein n=1 Tax=Hyaloscypha variabilis (strain UAMH 11265 / GT02V1 / F) TaxID=1149755 RepID=A0A2J6RM93_HYAVF|nr:hypothetical protein L207DRAFT_429185 [Hyaloscypha variabilis F]